MKKYLGFILGLLLITNIAYAASTVGEANLPVSTTTATTDNVRTVEGGISKQATVATIGTALGITAGSDGTWAIGSKVNSASPGYTCGAVGTPAYGYWHIESGGVPWYCYNENDYRLIMGTTGTSANRLLLATATASLIGSSSGTTLTEGTNTFTLTNGTASVAVSAGVTASFTATPMLVTQTFTQCMTIKDPVATSDFPIYFAGVASTIKATHCIITGSTNIAGEFDVCDSDCASNCAAVNADMTCTTTKQNVTGLTAAVAAGKCVNWRSQSASGTPTSLLACFDYTMP